MSDCSPLRLAENGQSSPSQSSGASGNSQLVQDNGNARQANHHRRRPNNRAAERVGGDPSGGSIDHEFLGEQRTRSHSESTSKSGRLRYGARNVIELFVPVSLCMFIVVGSMKITDSYRYSSQTVIWYATVMFTDQTVDTGTRVWQSFANAFIMLMMIITMTTVLIILYKFRCYKTIHGWLILSSLMLLFMFAITYVAEILKEFNIPVDNYTILFFIWNFGVVGMICIHWKGPLVAQQAYLITISALLALVFIRSLPDWTTWTVLAIVSVWDLIAVLCPIGPLRILVETAQERNEPIFPALIYSSTMVWFVMSTVIVSVTPSISMAADNDNQNQTGRNRRERSNRDRRSRHQQPQSQSSSSTSNRQRPKLATPSDMSSPTKRSQHPVEIHYEEGAQPPEVDIIQPTFSGTSDNWHTPNVRAVTTSRGRDVDDRITNTNDRARLQTSSNETAGELAINFQPPETSRGSDNHQHHHHQQQQLVEEERGVKLGLGDFIFYSLLVGKASSYNDWVITFSCYIAILVGLSLTLLLLAFFKKALPALPISITFGLCSFFMGNMFAAPFAEQLASDQIFI